MFNTARVPEAPEKIQTRILLFTYTQQIDGVILDYNNPAALAKSGFNSRARTFAFIHGFINNIQYQWIWVFKDALFRKVSTNSASPNCATKILFPGSSG